MVRPSLLAGVLLVLAVWGAPLAHVQCLFARLSQLHDSALILGLVLRVADLGRGAGRLLALTAALAYAFTLFLGLRDLQWSGGRSSGAGRRRLGGRCPRRPRRCGPTHRGDAPAMEV